MRGLYVCALGSTTTDIEMMCDANQSIIVADGPNKVMSQQLTSAINNRGLQVSQVLSLGAFRFLPLVDVTYTGARDTA